jgi:predicted dienelactone hydrolase
LPPTGSSLENDLAMTLGYRALDVGDPVQGVPLGVHLLYRAPDRSITQQLAFGPYAIDAAADAPFGESIEHVVAISHGTGSSPWTHRVVAAQLAEAGCVVALIAHAGNTRGDDALAGTPANLTNRPRHVTLALDAAFVALAAMDHITSQHRATLIGHSLGGYTALAAAGGSPLALPNETSDGVAHPVVVTCDPRVDRIALLAPAVPWLMAPGALDGVRARVLARTGERDELCPPAFVEHVLRGLPSAAALDYAVVPNAGHFSFMSPMPDALVRPGFAPAFDPPGFDRAAYQTVLGAELLAFIRSS